MNKLYILLLALFSILQVKAQVVIGNKNEVNSISKKPDVDFEINGKIKLEKLNIDGSANRTLITNTEGKLASKNNENENFRATDFYSLTIPKPISIKASEIEYFRGANYGYNTLNLSKDVVIEPNSSVRVSLEYNIPVVVVDMTDSLRPSYLGLTLFRVKDGVTEELDGGSRKYTIHTVREKSNGEDNILCLPITGSTVDEIINDTDQRKIVKYEIKAYSEIADKKISGFYTMYFGGYEKQKHIGIGVFIINVFEQALK